MNNLQKLEDADNRRPKLPSTMSSCSNVISRRTVRVFQWHQATTVA